MPSALRWRPTTTGGVGGRVFISYRRQLSWQLAQLVRNNLVEHHFDTFVDLENLDSGEFERTILRQIEAREHFIVLLEPGSLDQVGEDGDWLRREIAHALTHGRNVVPVTANGFQFRRNPVLPPDIARLPSFNAVPITSDYFVAAMKRLRTRFLKTPSKPTAPPPRETRSVMEPGRQALARPESLTSNKSLFSHAPQLTGQWNKNWTLLRLTWSAVLGAGEYVLEQARGPASRGDSKIFLEVYRGPNRSYDVPHAMFLPMSYRVRAIIFGQAGEWSDILESANIRLGE